MQLFNIENLKTVHKSYGEVSEQCNLFPYEVSKAQLKHEVFNAGEVEDAFLCSISIISCIVQV